MKKTAEFNIYPFLGKGFTCPVCSRKHFIPTRKLVMEKGAVSALPGVASALVKGGKLLVLCDNNTYGAAGERCAEVLGERYRVSTLVLSAGKGKKVHADERYLAGILKRLKDKDALITAGAGSITDMGKYAADRLKVPVISFPTAPSMNAYTSGVAAFISGGLKKTVPVEPAAGVVTDLDVISRAPLDLLKSGFADSMAKSFANADWRISSLFTGEDFCMLPFRITTAAEKRYINRGKKLLERDEKSVSGLMDGLNLGGFSMVIAGNSSPASGGEHLISHLLDMVAHSRGREPFAYHGLQVGLGTIVSAVIYEELKSLSGRAVAARLKRGRADCGEKLAWLAQENFDVTEEFGKKAPLLEKMRGDLPSMWERIREEAFVLVPPAGKLKTALKKAGCPLSFAEIGVDRKEALLSLIHI